MKKIPWKSIAIGCELFVLLVVARCVTTAGMTIYYKTGNYVDKILSDPWVYVGVAALGVGIVCHVMWYSEKKKAVAD